jgi:hypothetical protein
MNNRETFLQFITRESGFGRTSWWEFACIFGFGILSVYFAFTESPWALLGLMATAATIWGTVKNYTGRWK